MSIELYVAYAKAQSVSLHCTHAGRDALYDMQMLPVATPSGVFWSVLAQNGRRGARLSRLIKCSNTSLAEARRVYQEMLTEKMFKKHYLVVTSARQSELKAQVTAAEKSAVETLPSWPGFLDFVTDASRHVKGRIGINSPPLMCTIVALADVAFSAAEGLVDAIAQISAMGTSEGVTKLLSTEIRAWLRPVSEDVVAEELRSICARL